MTWGRKTGGKDFLEGNPGGPGRPRLPEDLKEARRAVKLEFEQIAQRLIRLPVPEVTRLAKSGETSALEAVVATIIVKAWSQGDQTRLNFLLDRLIGPVPKHIELPPPTDDGPLGDLSGLEITEAIQLVRKVKHQEVPCKSTAALLSQSLSVLPAPSSLPVLPTES